MLRYLEVINYGLIDHVKLDFQKGLTAITGETGSGKSILLGAFGLLLGERADSKSIKNANQKCIVEAIFDLSAFSMQPFFIENDLDFDITTTIRREISATGKSRAFINDTPVSLQQLKALGEQIVDIHSQHQNSILGDRIFQFAVLDAFAGNTDRLADYQTIFSTYKVQKEELELLLESESKMKQDLDYFQFQLDELEKIGLDHIDLKALEDELETLNNAEQIKSILTGVVATFDNESEGTLAQFASAKASLQKISPYNSVLADFQTRLGSLQIELKELSREIEIFCDSVQMDNERSSQIQDTIGAIYHLQQKHRIQSIEQLILLREEIREKVNLSSSVDDKIIALKKLLSETEQTLGVLCQVLTEEREKAAITAQNEVAQFFTALSLEHAQLSFEIKESKSFHALGKDEIQLLFKANKGGQLLPIQKVASGGEISRVMLALKAAISERKKLPVLILDEIDQGVSGEVGKKIGQILKTMSANMQLITITHLPQIAGKADHHLKVRKETRELDTTTLVEHLSQEHRLKEIAEMLSGKEFTKAALENAKELMN